MTVETRNRGASVISFLRRFAGRAEFSHLASECPMLDSERASAPTVPRQQPSGSRLQRLWRALRSPSNHWSILSLAALGALVGVFGIVTLNVALHATASNTFCAACHAQNAALDWEQSSHYRNRTGFIAGCGDCHVPQNFFARMAREGRVPREILSQFSGKISTPEKYEAHRLAMAQNEWARLRKNNSQECRDCHRVGAMADSGNPSVSVMHRTGLRSGQTCIDCHKGVAHIAPNEMAQSSGKKG